MPHGQMVLDIHLSEKVVLLLVQSLSGSVYADGYERILHRLIILAERLTMATTRPVHIPCVEQGEVQEIFDKVGWEISCIIKEETP